MNQTFTVSGAGGTFTGDANHPTDIQQNVNAKTYTVAVPTGTSVRIELFNAANVTTSATGFTTFTRVGAVAQPGTLPAVSAFINQVNGNTIPNATAVPSITSVNGQISFRVSGNQTAFGSVVPVVFVANAAGQLIVNDSGAPTGSFGVGAVATVNPIEAPTTTVQSVAVVAINAANNSFIGRATAATNPVVAGDLAVDQHGLYFYSSADTFQVAGDSFGTGATGLSRFLNNLSVGDTVAVTYSRVAADTFNLTADAPGLPTNVSAAFVDTNLDGTNNVVRITWTNPQNTHLAGYRIQRATVASDGTVGTFVQVDANGTAGDTTVTLAQTNPAVSDLTTANATVSWDIDITPDGAPQATANRTYVYRVRALGVGNTVPTGTGAAAWSANSNELTRAASPAAISGLTLAGALQVGEFDANPADPLVIANGDNLAAGSAVRVTFSAPVVAASNASITLANSAGQVVSVTRGVNTLAGGVTAGPAATIQFELSSAPTLVSGGALPFALPAGGAIQLIGVSGISNASTGASVINLRAAATVYANKTVGDLEVLPPVGPPSASAAAGTVTATTVGADRVIRVYDATGQTLLGSSPTVATAGAVTFGVPGLTLNQNIIIVQVPSAAAQSNIQSLGVNVEVLA